MTAAVADAGVAPRPAPAGMSEAARKRPHETRIKANYATYLAEDTPERTRQRMTTLLYNDIRELALAIVVKKYGMSYRIDVEAITHEVATSAVMTVVCRRKPVFSWVHLIRKISYDQVNKWMKYNLYSASASNVSLDGDRGDDEDSDGEHSDRHSHDIACHDMDPGAVNFYQGFRQDRVAAAVASLQSLTGVRGAVMRRLVMTVALHDNWTWLVLLPPMQQARARFYIHQVRRILLPLISSDHFQREFL